MATITTDANGENYLLNMIEGRIREIGKTYHANGQSFQDDLELSELRAISRQMGHEFDVKSAGDGFSVTRVAYP